MFNKIDINFQIFSYIQKLEINVIIKKNDINIIIRRKNGKIRIII